MSSSYQLSPSPLSPRTCHPRCSCQSIGLCSLIGSSRWCWRIVQDLRFHDPISFLDSFSREKLSDCPSKSFPLGPPRPPAHDVWIKIAFAHLFYSRICIDERTLDLDRGVMFKCRFVCEIDRRTFFVPRDSSCENQVASKSARRQLR